MEYDEQMSRSQLREKCETLQEEVSTLEEVAADRKATIEGLRDSQRRLQALAESTHDWAWKVNADWEFIYVSPQVKDLLGYAPEEIEGRKPFDFMPAKESQLAAEAFMEFLEEERVFTGYEHHKWHKDGHRIAMESSGVPMYEGDELVGFWGVDRDISTRENACQQLRRAHKELKKRVEERTRELKETNELLSREVKERREAQAELRQTSRRLNTLIEAIPDCLYFKDLEGRNLLVNKAYEELFDVSSSEIVGKTDEEVVPQELAEQCRESDARALEEKRTVRVEEKCEVDGEQRWLETVKAPVMGENGDMKGLVGLSRDITEKKRAEKALRTAEERYRKLAENSIQGMVIFQGDPPEIRYTNPGFSGILGYTPEELMHLSSSECRDLIHPADRERIFDRYRRRLAGEDLDPITETRLIASDGSVRWVQLHAARIECKGEPCVLATYVDITRWKRENGRLEQRCQYLSNAFDEAGIGLAQIDQNFVVEEMNELMRSRASDVKSAEDISCCDILNGGDLNLECPSCPIHKTLKSGSPSSCVEVAQDRHTVEIIQITAFPSCMDGEKPDEVFAVLEKLTGDGRDLNNSADG